MKVETESATNIIVSNIQNSISEYDTSTKLLSQNKSKNNIKIRKNHYQC